MAQNSGAPRSHRSHEDYITQVSEEIEWRVTKRLSKEFSRTENRILGALARLDDFLMKPLLPGHSGTTPEPTRNTSHNNQGTNEDGSRNDPHPEAGPFHGQTTRNVSLEGDHDMVTGVQRKNLCQRDMVTGAIEQNRNCHDMTEVHEEVTYCSPSTSSGKQKKTALPVNRNSAVKTPLRRSIHNNINRISKLPKSLTTTMRTFDGKTEKFELFEDLFQTSLKIHNQLTEDDRINYFQSLMRGDALQTYKNINGPTRENLGEILAVFRRKYIKP